MYGLPPGDYYVSATLRGGWSCRDDDLEVMMVDGMGRGPSPTGSTPNSGYAPTYFPGTAHQPKRRRVTLAVGQEAQQTDFALLPVRLASVRRRHVVRRQACRERDGEPGAAAAAGDIGDDDGPSCRARTTGKEDTSPSTASRPATTPAGAVDAHHHGCAAATMASPPRWAAPVARRASSPRCPWRVAGEDLGNVVVVTSKGATATGSVSFEGGGEAGERDGDPA